MRKWKKWRTLTLNPHPFPNPLQFQSSTNPLPIHWLSWYKFQGHQPWSLAPGSIPSHDNNLLYFSWWRGDFEQLEGAFWTVILYIYFIEMFFLKRVFFYWSAACKWKLEATCGKSFGQKLTKKKGGFTLMDSGSSTILAFLPYATLKRPQKKILQYSFCMVSFQI